MKYHEILAALREPVLMEAGAVEGLLRLFEEHRTGREQSLLTSAATIEERAAREGVGTCGERVELEQMEVYDGVAHVPICGPLGRGLGKFEKGAGATDFGDVCDDLDAAEENPEVRAVLLDIDSPGGSWNGTPECADRISACQVPVYAFSGGQIMSAAYWLACATEGIFITRSAGVGAIGVYSSYTDVSEACAKAGARVQVFSSGKYKGAGVPGTSLSREQAEFLQARILEMASAFYAHVHGTRPDVEDGDMQGQWFVGESAVKRGLVDGVVRDKEEVCRMIAGETG